MYSNEYIIKKCYEELEIKDEDLSMNSNDGAIYRKEI
jgi:hypothetical protein